MNSKDKWLWIPMIALMVGAGLPPILVGFAEDSWQERIWVGMFTTMGAFTYAVFKKAGSRMLVISKWVEESLIGSTALVFVFTFVASGASALFATLPVPLWIHLLAGGCFAIAALTMLTKKAP